MSNFKKSFHEVKQFKPTTFENKFGIVVSILGIVVFVFSAYQQYASFSQISNTTTIAELSKIFWPLSLSIVLLVISFIAFGFSFHKIMTKTNTYVQNAIGIEEAFNRQESIIRVQTTAYHNFLHYLKYIMAGIDEIIYSRNKITEKHIHSILKDIRTFFFNVLNNTKTMFDLITNDNCAVCIKLAGADNKGKKKFKTLYRDAFSLIMNPNQPDRWFFSNDLTKLDNYKNHNSDWRNRY
ncbi:MAG: hypothetical protein ACR2PY_09555 [Salinispira sp.]